MFEFWIDGIKYADPLNWKDFTETIEYDDQLNVFLFEYKNSLNFSGDAYNYLYNKRNTGGVCYIADIVVKKQCAPGGSMLEIFAGKIFVADCTFFINKCIVECSIQDNNYSALLFNNKDIKLGMELTESKNGVPIPVSSLYLNSSGYLRNFINMFNPTNGAVIGGQDIRMYFPHDAFAYLIYFLTDGQVGFKSNYLNYLTPITKESEKVRQLMFTTGYNIRVYSLNIQKDVIISFQDLFTEINKKYPIFISVEYDSTGKPIIRIEDADYYRSLTSTSVTLNNVPEVKEKSDNSLLFGSVRIGGQTAKYTAGLHSYIPTKDITFQEENYYLNGECNTSTDKDLYGNYIVDSNIIQELFITNTSNTSYDTDIVFIEVNPTTGASSAIYNAIATANYNDLTDYHYNDSLLNINIVKRNRFHGDTSNGIGGGITLLNNSTTPAGSVFLGSQFNCASGVPVSAQTGSASDLLFTIDNIAVFNGTKYTSLVSGSFTFFHNLSYKVDLYSDAGCPTSFLNRRFNIVTNVKRFNAANVLQETQVFTDTAASATGTYNYSFTSSFSMIAGDYIKAESYYVSVPVDYTLPSGISVTMLSGSPTIGIFNTLSTPTSAGVNSSSNGFNYACNIITFDFPIPEQTYNTLKANIAYAVAWNIDGTNNKTSWIKSVSRTLATSETQWELIGTITNSQ